MKLKNATAALTICIAALLLSGPVHAEDDWSFQLEPYLLASSIDGDTSVGRVTGADVAVDFGDILEVLELGGMVHFEAHHTSGWGAILDYGFMDLGADISGPRGGIVGAEVRQGVLEALVVRRFETGDRTIDYMAGVRWWDNDIDVAVDPAVLPGTAMFDVQEDWLDLVLGIRWTNRLNENWKHFIRGDLGGLGLESDFTGSVALGLHYQISKRVDLDLQYKATWVDFEDGSPGESGYFAYDTVTHGPIVGFIFNF